VLQLPDPLAAMALLQLMMKNQQWLLVYSFYQYNLLLLLRCLLDYCLFEVSAEEIHRLSTQKKMIHEQQQQDRL
jgi:hypothetical protein